LLVKTADEAIRPIATLAYPTPAARPLNSRISAKKLSETFSIDLPEWQIGVERMLPEVLPGLRAENSLISPVIDSVTSSLQVDRRI
jgi:hypothetical protein